jgi:hypothetical protein
MLQIAVRGAMAALTLAAASTAGAQTLDDIVARHIEARGGYARLKAIGTIKITRTIATPFTDVKVVLYKKRPHLLRVEQTIAGQPMVPRAIGPAEAWDTIKGKVVARPPQAFAEGRDLDGDFEGLLIDWKAKGHVVELEGKEALPGGDAYKLKVTTKSGATGHVYLDDRTYLDRRHVNLTGMRQAHVVVDFAGWRDVDGVKFPFDITEERTSKAPVQTLVTYTEKIELDVPMDDSLFSAPKGA